MIKPLTISTLLLGAIFTHAKSGSADDRNFTYDTGIIVFGGFNTCTISGNPEGIAILQPLKDKIQIASQALLTPVRYFIGCYQLNRDRVIISHDQMPKPGHTKEIDLAQLGDYLLDWQTSGSSLSRIFMVGTSYGGWTIMKMLEEGFVPKDLIGGIYTIDPISHDDCTPQIMLNNAITLNSNYKDKSDNPCRRAPKYWENKSEWAGLPWINFYQEDYPLLHSSRAAHAAENLLIPYKTPLLKYLAHRQIQEDSRVWSLILKDMSAP